ncbi:pro-opiomelanocortin [Trichosurus vulpecula]|uniref:pro-opiomelanocortin n=1 Tax=Trichosurus vulpecula TaxID=9337 RepID=UPI00186B1C88|nr:pro-opiomelanocortin [Trichosurus vulpecula]
MPKPSWSCLGALLVALLFQTSESVYPRCQLSTRCRKDKTQEQCLRSCSPAVALAGAHEPKDLIKRRDIYSGSLSSDGENVEKKRQELMQGDLPDLLSLGVWGEDKEVQEEGLPLMRKARELDNKRSYSMEHFRWGKPVGKKRRPVKVFPNGVEEESTESYSVEFKRDIPNKEYIEVPDVADDEAEDSPGPNGENKKKKKRYEMQHFRWGTPPKVRTKRYGGFMVSEKSHTPLMTLFKNAIIKSAHEKGQ